MLLAQADFSTLYHAEFAKISMAQAASPLFAGFTGACGRPTDCWRKQEEEEEGGGGGG